MAKENKLPVTPVDRDKETELKALKAGAYDLNVVINNASSRVQNINAAIAQLTKEIAAEKAKHVEELEDDKVTN